MVQVCVHVAHPRSCFRGSLLHWDDDWYEAAEGAIKDSHVLGQRFNLGSDRKGLKSAETVNLCYGVDIWETGRLGSRVKRTSKLGVGGQLRRFLLVDAWGTNTQGLGGKLAGEVKRQILLNYRPLFSWLGYLFCISALDTVSPGFSLSFRKMYPCVGLF